MKILYATSEMAPYSKTGGLADVAGALPDEIADARNDVVCISPMYHSVVKEGFPLVDTGKQVGCYIGDKPRSGRIFTLDEDLPAQRWFIANDSYFDREELYQTSAGDYPDNAERFIFFSKALLRAAKAMEFKPDIVHVNDWQTALAAVFLRTIMRNDTFFANAKCLLTIHNLGYQGLFWHWDWPMLNLGWEYFTPDTLEFYEKINFLKGGIVFADAVTTVSKRYAKEIQTEEYGRGLEGTLHNHAGKLRGILNGIDSDTWNPATDKYIVANYSAKDPSGKAACKADLQKEMGLAGEPEVPLFGVITRLTEQKGIDLLIEAIPDLMRSGIQLVILGQGNPEYEESLNKLTQENPKRIAVRIAHSEELAHKIEAGCDFFLMPSKYEPCGLNQMYSLAYGTIPVVRATGGLDDTVTNFSEKTGRGNGVKFKDFTAKALVRAVKKAINIYKKKAMAMLVKNAFASDFSWQRSAKEYIKLYRKMARPHK
jgi:starch synthase